MLYIKFNIQDTAKFADFQDLYNHMIAIRQPGFQEDEGPNFDWDSMTKEEVDVALVELNDFLDTSPEVLRYNKLIPDYAKEYLEKYVELDNKKLESLGIHNVISVFNYLEYGFEVDMEKLEKTNEQYGIVELSTGNYPFGGIERFLITLRAFNIIPLECFDGFEVCEITWHSNFEYEMIAQPKKTKKLKSKNTNENPDNPKQRHGCVTAWLILMIVVNSLTALSYLLAGNSVSENFPNGVSSSMLIILALLGIANVIFAVLLFQWNKIGFWGFLTTSIIVLGVNLSIGISLGSSLLGLLGVVVLYAVFQIKKDTVPAWNHLE